MLIGLIILVFAILGLTLGFSPLFAVLLVIPAILGYLLWVGNKGEIRPDNVTRGGRPIEEIPEREADVERPARDLHG